VASNIAIMPASYSQNPAGCTMVKVGMDEKVYPVAKIALVVDALRESGVAPDEALQGAHVSAAELNSPTARMSLSQVLAVYRNAVRLATNPHFAYLTGLRIHVSTYGMYGFALLSSTNFRETMQIAMQFHQLATPLTEMLFKEANGRGVWTIAPLPHQLIDADLYKFLVELQFGHIVSMHRDVMGPSFAPSLIHVTYAEPHGVQGFARPFGCEIFFSQPENRLMFDAAWLDPPAMLGNPVTHPSVVALCDTLLEELELRSGLAGKVREVLLRNLGHDTSLASVSEQLKIPQRTLRRRLLEEGTSFREIAEHLRKQLAIKYLRDTDLSVEDIAFALGFSDASNFRHALRRWTDKSPNEFRNRSGTRRTD
jgi:AraC-like DNA-binding protein